MKKILTVIIGLLFLVALFGCTGNVNADDPVLETPPPDDFVIDEPSSDGDPTSDGPPHATSPIDPNTIPTIDPNIPLPSENITAWELIANIRLGWNLGNTFDAHDFSWLGAHPSVSAMETAWQPNRTSKANMDALKAAGFNAIRIPVTWIKATDDDYIIREDWMARIKEVVDFAMGSEMIVILNSHHDESYFSMLDEDLERTKEYFTKIWEQIAEEFKDYSEMLVFEGFNEPRTRGSSAEWNGGTAKEHNNLNILNQNFVDIIRQSGGNNGNRILVIPTYAASATTTAQKGLVLPIDTIEDKLIVSIHSYAPWEFALRTGHDRPLEWSKDNANDTRPITEPIDMAFDLFVSNGIPVIMGETGTINRNNLPSRVEWAEFYIMYAKSKGIPCFWWDNGASHLTKQQSWGWEETFGIFNRATNELDHPEIMDALLIGMR
ncbi:MAG: glycoside hydrolase family 5 protein [Oscillospiraceae bacterium]|nr:glycoside hydrolase family 5 protein [Oscillospiraceae bacterium]